MLELKNVSYEVNEDQREIEILKNINLKIEERFVAITGPNGGGKSTLAKIIAGILVPTSGQILLDGEDITGMNITERAKAGISFAFQQPVRFKGITVRDLITLAAGKNLTTAEACSYLSEVGLCAQEYINREVNASLSGGELKRIEIAMVIALGCSLGMCLPISTPPNAIAYSTGTTPTKEMAIVGVIVGVIGIILLSFVVPLTWGAIGVM